jgi:O-acetylserine/cysteine efflux transporter
MFLLTPIIGVFAGVTLLGDVVTLQIAVGGALVIGGVAVITIRSARKGAEPVAEAVP